MNEGEEIRFIDLFSGIGGFRLGLEKANTRMEKDSVENNFAERSCTKPQTIGTRKEERTGHFRCVWSCDNNKYANQVYTKHFGEEGHYSGDVRGVDPREIPDFDLLCAGFPCQSFSVAGPRTGFQDTRGTLFFEISRIAEAKRPQMLLLENVKGLLSNDRGQTFQTILQELGRIGYWAEWQILNSKHHGVPQNRERVFIVGHLRGTGGREIFPIGETDEMAKKDVRGRSPVQPEVSTAIDGSYYKGVDRHGQRTVVLDTFNRGSKEEEAYALKTNPSPTSSAVVMTPIGSDKPTVRAGGRGSLERHAWDTLTDGFRIRRLTPMECERLQGFPDGWTEWGIQQAGTVIHDEGTDDEWVEVTSEAKTVRISDTQRYRALGNAVTTNVVAFLGRKILEAEK